MSSKRGGRRSGAGRPKGSRNRYNADMENLLQERMAEIGHEGYDPVVALAEIGLDENNPIEIRLRAHAEVAQYVRTKRMATAVSCVDERTMTRAERRRRIRELSKVLGYRGA